MRVGNAFQNVRRAEEIFEREFDVPLLDVLSEDEINSFINTFEKRHSITHNLGIVDKKYIDRARTAEEEGREILVNEVEINSAIEFSMRIFRAVHVHLFGNVNQNADIKKNY